MEHFGTVTWFLDNGDTEFNNFDTEIIDCEYLLKKTIYHWMSNGDGIPDTYGIENLVAWLLFCTNTRLSS